MSLSAPIESVADTAFWVAHFRALESARPDALFRDLLAARLVGQHGATIAKRMGNSRLTQWTVVLRTCMIDAFLQNLVADGTDTVLNLGAGLDTRPYRLDLPSTLRWIEVDHPQVIALKNERLADAPPRCLLQRIALDLADRPARVAMLKEISGGASKMAVLTEGVLPYLSNDDVGQLADDLRALSSLDAWIVDYYAPWIYEAMWRERNDHQLKNAPLRFRPADWTAFFASHRWRVRQLRYIQEEAQKHGRRPPVGPITALKFLLASRKQHDDVRKNAGYAILEPLVVGGR